MPLRPLRSRPRPLSAGPLARGMCALALLSVLTSAALSSAARADAADAPASLAWDPAHTPLEASATLSADGAFTLLLLPGTPWKAAELTVSGDGSHDLGPSDGTAPVEVAGVREGLGPIRVELVAVTPDDHGVSWSFEVQPELLPVQAPASPPAEGKKRRGRRARAAQP